MIINNLADIVLIVIMFASVALSIWRGFSKEILILLSFIVSLYVAYRYGSQIGNYCTFLSAALLRQGFGYFLAFSLTSLVAGLMRALLIKSLNFNSGGIDRTFGALFGVLRGGIAASLLVAALHNTPIIEQPWWENSVIIPRIEKTSIQTLASIPQEWKSEVLAIIENFSVEYA